MERAAKILVIGYGNPGRRDDGLGPALAAALEELALPDVTIDSDYQLSVEHAHAVAEHDVVVFIDAACEGPAPFSFRRLRPESSLSFSTHSVRAEAVLGLCEELFGRSVPGYVLAIRGYEFDKFGESLSDNARESFAAALAFMRPILRDRTFCESVTDADHAAAGAAPDNGNQRCKTENT